MPIPSKNNKCLCRDYEINAIIGVYFPRERKHLKALLACSLISYKLRTDHIKVSLSSLLLHSHFYELIGASLNVDYLLVVFFTKGLY